MKPYYIATPDGQRKGPFQESFIRSQYEKGVYSADTPTWTEGMEDWAPLSIVLSSAAAVAPNFNNPFTAFLHACKNIRLRGRARRQEYWMAYLGSIIVGFILLVVTSMLGVVDSSGVLAGLFALLINLFNIFVGVVFIALGCRRLHDTGRSGWWQLIILVPFIGFIVLLVFLCQDSQPGSNMYGENPKGL